MIFISYRIADANDMVSRLAASLMKRFGRNAVFHDKSRLGGGQVWPAEIERAARNCCVMLVVIGETWETAAFEGAAGRRGGSPLADPADWVRKEIAIALDSNRIVIPVLLNKAELPAGTWLARIQLEELGRRQAVKLRTDDYDGDFAELARQIRKACPNNKKLLWVGSAIIIPFVLLLVWWVRLLLDDPPIVDLAVYPIRGPAPLDVLLDAGKTSDPENDQLTFSWAIDGIEVPGSFTLLPRRFDRPGNYEVALRVRDRRWVREEKAQVVCEEQQVGSRRTSFFRSTPVRFTGSKGPPIKSDGDVGSDDWTEVTVSYKLTKSVDDRRVELTVQMDVRELEDDQSYDNNTHLRITSKPITILELKKTDPRRIVSIDAAESGSRVAKLRGKLRGSQSFADVGPLRNISVVVDGGGDDRSRQSLEAQFSCDVVLEE